MRKTSSVAVVPKDTTFRSLTIALLAAFVLAGALGAQAPTRTDDAIKVMAERVRDGVEAERRAGAVYSGDRVRMDRAERERWERDRRDRDRWERERWERERRDRERWEKERRNLEKFCRKRPDHQRCDELYRYGRGDRRGDWCRDQNRDGRCDVDRRRRDDGGWWPF